MKLLIQRFLFSSVLPTWASNQWYFRATVSSEDAYSGAGVSLLRQGSATTVYGQMRIQIRLNGCHDLYTFASVFIAQRGGAVVSASHGILDIICSVPTAQVIMNACRAYRGGRVSVLSRPVISLFAKRNPHPFAAIDLDDHGDVRRFDLSLLEETPATVEVIQFNEGGVNYEAASSTSEILQVEVADADASYPPASSVFASPYDVPAPHKLAFARAKAFAVANGKMAAKDGVVDLQGVPVDIGWEEADFNVEFEIEVVSKYPNN